MALSTARSVSCLLLLLLLLFFCGAGTGGVRTYTGGWREGGCVFAHGSHHGTRVKSGQSVLAATPAAPLPPSRMVRAHVPKQRRGLVTWAGGLAVLAALSGAYTGALSAAVNGMGWCALLKRARPAQARTA